MSASGTGVVTFGCCIAGGVGGGQKKKNTKEKNLAGCPVNMSCFRGQCKSTSFLGFSVIEVGI